MRPEITLKDIFSNTLKTRRIVILITLFFSIATYYYLVDFYATDFSIFSYPLRKLPPYEIYSGNARLTYFLVGDYLEREFPVKNQITKGGIENAQKVLTSTDPSFGLVQEDVLKADDFMKTHLNFAAPIYLERMHIIYDQNVFKKYQIGSQDSNIPQISSYTRPELLDFFAHAKINIGPVGSGTKIIASYIMEAINEQTRAQQAERINTNMAASVEQIGGELARGNYPTRSSMNSTHRPSQDDINEPGQQILLTDSWEALDCLRAKYQSDNQDARFKCPDIVFVVTGSPCELVGNLIMSDDFGLISIDSTFINNLNLKHGTNFRATDFNGKYVNTKYNGAATLGTYAYLVTDQRTPTIDILKILERLDTLKPKEEKSSHKESEEEKQARELARKKRMLECIKEEKAPQKESEEEKRAREKKKLACIFEDDFDFLTYYNKQSQSRFMLSLRNLLVFLVTLGTAFTPSFIFLSWFISGIQQMKYLAKLSKVIEENIPINEEIDSSISGKVTGEGALSKDNNEKDQDVDGKGNDGSFDQGGAKVTGEAAPSNGNNEKDQDVESKGNDGSAGAGDGVVKSGIGNRKNPLFRGWIDSSIQLVREFIRSGKVMGEGAPLNNNNKKDQDVESKGNDDSFDQGGAHYRNYLLPTIDDDQTPIINKIISGQNKLNKLRKEISKDTGVNDTHTTFLIGRIDPIVDKLRKSLAIRLNRVIENDKLRKSLNIENHDWEVNEMLLKYLTAEWITKDDYEWLIAKLHESKLS
jgi:TRAP-type uncharacterized transport system substrate-binding protein